MGAQGWAEARLLAVTHRPVTMDALHAAGGLGAPGRGAHGEHRVDEVAVTAHAVLLEDAAARRLDFDRLSEVLSGEQFAVAPAVLGLGDVLRDEALGQVTIHADRRRVMARLLPGVVLRLHDVAVHAGGRVRAEIGETLRVAVCVPADAGERAEGHGEQERPPGPVGLVLLPGVARRGALRLRRPVLR